MGADIHLGPMDKGRKDPSTVNICMDYNVNVFCIHFISSACTCDGLLQVFPCRQIQDLLYFWRRVTHSTQEIESELILVTKGVLL